MEDSYLERSRKIVFAITGERPSDGDPLITSGRLSSFSIVSIILEIEEEFGVILNPQDIKREDFDTISLIANTVRHFEELQAQ